MTYAATQVASDGVQHCIDTHLLSELHLLALFLMHVFSVIFDVLHFRLQVVQAHQDTIDHLFVLHSVQRVLEMIQPQKSLC
jgi:hypothetical protein